MTFQHDFGDSSIACIEELLVMPSEPSMYRLEEIAVFGGVNYHDIVEAKPQHDGTLRFIRVLAPCELKTECWGLRDSDFESPALTAFLEKVLTVGGNWERKFGGLLFLHLPSTEHDLIVRELKDLVNQLPR
jgi:hypothetical protein